MTPPSKITSTERLLETIRGKASAKSSAPKTAPAAARRKQRHRKGGALVVGVDIAPDALRMAKIERTEAGARLRGYWSVPYPQGVDPKSPDFAPFLSARVGEFRGQDKKAELWSLVSSAQAETYHVRVPKVSRSKLSETIYWTAQKEKSFDASEFLMDYEVQGEIMDKGVPKIQALVYMVPREVVSRAKALFSAAGLKPTGLTISPIALQSLFRSSLVTENGESCANIYIGRNWSRIDVFAKGDLVLSRGVNTGTSSLVSALAEAYGDRVARQAAAPARPAEIKTPGAAEEPMFELEADEAQAEPMFELEADAPAAEPVFELELDGSAEEPVFELEQEAAPVEEPRPAPAAAEPMDEDRAKEVLLARLLGHPLEGEGPGSELDAEEVVHLAGAAVSRLVRQIERTFDHHINTLGGDPVRRIFFSGDICTNTHFLEVLTSELGVPCSLLDPLGLLGTKPGAPDVEDSPAVRLGFNLACGLALCDATDTPNLLWTYQDKDKTHQIRRQGNMVYGVFLALVAVMAAAWFMQHEKTTALEAELQGLNTRIAAFRPKVDEAGLLAMARKTADLQRQIKILSEKYEGLAAINEVSRLTPENIKLHSMALELGRPEDAAKKPEAGRRGAQGADKAPRIMILDGMVSGPPEMFDAMLATYLAKLQYSPLFSAPVVHKREIEIRKGKGDVLRFILHVNVV
ncbi:hypothetical protein [Desulfocurvus sp. DL9XJH121]